jgi:integrase
MATEKVLIADTHINNAKKLAASGSIPVSKPMFYTDLKLTGLRLMIRGKRATWIARWKNHSIVIGHAYGSHSRIVTAPKTVRDLATTVLNLLRDEPEKVEPFLDAHWAGQAKSEALKAVHKKASTWTFRECVTNTLKGKTALDAKGKISPNTVKDYKGTFKRDIFQPVLDKPAISVTKADIEAIRDHVRTTVGAASATKVVTYTRAVYNYCARYHSGQSGLDQLVQWWNLLNAPYELKPKTRRPEVEAIVATLILAEDYLTKPMPGRAQGVTGVNAGVLAGLWWLVLTCQRANAGLSLLSHDIVPDPNAEDFLLAAWAENVMKSGQAHVLPIPKRAWDFIECFRPHVHKGENQDWAFPSERKPEVNIGQSSVYRILYRLAGRDEVEQKPKQKLKGKKVPERTKRRNLLEEAGIDWWSPHDLRRTITMVLDEHGIPGGATVILAHDIHEKSELAATASERERENFLRLRTARITKMAYGGAQYLGLKKEAMRIWTDTILDEYERQKASAIVYAK